jgi:hypothetical protein
VGVLSGRGRGGLGRRGVQLQFQKNKRRPKAPLKSLR